MARNNQVVQRLTVLSMLCIASRVTAAAEGSMNLPMVINTWAGPFTAATDAAFEVLSLTPHNTTALDAVQIGCATCERNQCDGTVGFGGSPDENCETTLDALIMDGQTLRSGAVAGLRRVRDAIGVARLVHDYTEHSLLAGDLATRFAVDFGGFVEENLATTESLAQCEAWRAADCQPNYRAGHIVPDAGAQCGPYAPWKASDSLDNAELHEGNSFESSSSKRSHDTISMVAIHSDGTMAAGTSSNGATHKVPGRVGDGPIVGSGSYVDSDIGGCGATGDGDIMMRFLPCYQAVENMRRGLSPQEAADDAVSRMIKRYPMAMTGIVVVDNKGQHAGAGSGWTFTYAFRSGDMKEAVTVTVPALQP
ncbi:nucleophile aminohydrolase [Coniella lustricola]|uniref:Nucleophile aminohydrolase n=1 Tax=Coniella lustricola TaxID=2025994 RepID=A0A2T2ZUN0_9PEZI|nr:nucleophile aminohydrolase [Coniella lustricola]